MFQCPLGYGSGKAKANPMACAKCRGIAFEPTYAKQCKCVYCDGCIDGVADCFLCGRDIEGSEPAPDFAEKIDVFVKAHAPKNARELGMFWLEHAVKHEKAGNMFGADRRYTQAMESFKGDIVSEEEVAICLSKLAEIRWVSLNDSESAREMFQESIRILSEGKSRSPALAVTCMKWGGMEHAAGNFPKALELFTSAVTVRQLAHTNGLCTPEDICASQFAVANVCMDMGDKENAQEQFQAVVTNLKLSRAQSERASVMKEQSQAQLIDLAKSKEET